MKHAVTGKNSNDMEKLLFTGGSGFLGRNAKPILDTIYQVTTIGISDTDMVKVNLAKEVPELHDKYDVVLHAAGKAHVYPKTEQEKKEFYDINLQGTINLCKALEKFGVPRAFVFISTLNVYGNKPGRMDTEISRILVGDSPYSDSKIKAEQFLIDWCAKNGVTLGILRPGLLVASNAPGNLGAMINGIKKGFYVNIAHGSARKSMLMAEDIARLVPLITKKGGIYNVCDNHNPSFGELSEVIAHQLGKRKPISIPFWFAKYIAKIGDIFSVFPINTKRLEKIITDDTWSNEKAKSELGWEPMDVLDHFKI